MHSRTYSSLATCALLCVAFTASTGHAQEEPKKDAPPAPAAPAPTPPAAPAPPTGTDPTVKPNATQEPSQPGGIGDPGTRPGRSPDPPGGAAPVDPTLPPLSGGTPLASDVTHQSDFMDTRLTWTFGDDDVTKATGEAYPISPKVSVGDRPQYRLFFDNLNSRFAGRENLSHLVLYKKMPGYIEDLETEAAVVLRVDMSQLAANANNVNSAFYDAGSYLRIFYKTKKISENKYAGFDFVFFPLDTDRFRLGYLYDISWGGTAQSINQSIFPRLTGSAPGAKFQYTGDGVYAFIGFKTAQIIEPQVKVSSALNQDIEYTRIQETNYGVLAGGGFDFSDNFRADVGAGYFQQGRFEQPDVEGRQVYTYGGSARIVVHDQMPVPASVDFMLYKNDPNAPMVIFRPEVYRPGTVSWAVSAEASNLEQNLKDFDRPGATKLQSATAAALQGTVKAGYTRLQVTGIYRDLAFVVRNQPGYIPFETMPGAAKLQPEMFFALALDHYLDGARLTPGIGGGVQLPATFSSSQVDQFGTDIGRTTVIRSQGDLSPLPDGKNRVPIIQARVSLRWDISRIMAAVVWGQLVHDNNATKLEQGDDGLTNIRSFQSPNFIGFGLSLQARF